MTTITVKIVGVENESVLVKYASEHSLKSIDEYEAIAYQPALMGYNSIESFIEGIKPSLLSQVEARDAAEQMNLDLTSWQNYQTTTTVTPVVTPSDATVIIPMPTSAQLVNSTPEVIL